MARPIKSGLDYYPKDTNLFSDRKVKKLINEFGAKGYMVFEYLLCIIYSDKGYYVECDVDLHFDVASSLGNGITEELVREVIKGCFRYGLLNYNLFKMFNIYTSNGIQKRYLLAKRNGKIKKEYLVITAETEVLTVITEVIDTIMPVTTVISTQRKEKESKVNKITESEFIEIWKKARTYYDKKFTGFDKLVFVERQNFNNLLEDYSCKDFEYAVAGLFFQDTYDSVRVRPDWLLRRENFEKMLDCWKNKTKVFDNSKKEVTKAKFSVGDV